MAWTTPRTFVVSEILTAGIFNTHLRDNLNFLYSKPRCSLKRSSAKSITSGAATQIDFNQEDYDNDSMHSTSSNTTRATFVTAGVYDCKANVDWQSNATARRSAYFKINGTATSFAPQNHSPASSGESSFGLTLDRQFAANDYIELEVYQDSGSTLTVSAVMTVHMVGN